MGIIDDLFRQKRRPPPPPPDPPRERTLAVIVRDDHGQPIDQAVVQLGDRSGLTNRDGYVAWDHVPASYTVLPILVAKTSYSTYTTGTLTIPPGNADLPVVLIRQVPDIPALHVTAAAFRLPDGTPWKWRGLTAFTAFYDFCAGRLDKLERYAEGSRALGVNTWRVFGMWWTLNWGPQVELGYYHKLEQFCRWMHGQGLRLEFVLFCDQVAGSSVWMSRDGRTHDADAQTRHVVASLEVLRRHQHTFCELCNEGFKNGGVELTGRYARSVFAGVLTARTSPDDTERPDAPGPILDYTTHHPPRTWDQTRKPKELVDVARLGFDGFRPTMLPAVADEPGKLEELSPRQWGQYAALCDLFGAGMTAHGGYRSLGRGLTDLQNCILPLPGQPGYAELQAITEAWRLPIPIDAASAGDYTRGPFDSCALQHQDRYTDSGENPAGALRTFGMILGTRQTVVLCDPGPAHQIVATPGWRVMDVRGDVVFAERT